MCAAIIAIFNCTEKWLHDSFLESHEMSANHDTRADVRYDAISRAEKGTEK